MNANELADKLMSSLTMEYDCDEYMEQAATMLRQQQAEIEALKAEIIEWISDSPYNITPDEYFKTILRKAQEK
jgi:hypothetical protein